MELELKGLTASVEGDELAAYLMVSSAKESERVELCFVRQGNKECIQVRVSLSELLAALETVRHFNELRPAEGVF